MNPMIREIITLATGTQAKLFKLSRYDEIEAAVAKWVEWVEQNPKQWPTWQDCWEDYKATLETPNNPV